MINPQKGIEYALLALSTWLYGASSSSLNLEFSEHLKNIKVKEKQGKIFWKFNWKIPA